MQRTPVSTARTPGSAKHVAAIMAPSMVHATFMQSFPASLAIHQISLNIKQKVSANAVVNFFDLFNLLN